MAAKKRLTDADIETIQEKAALGWSMRIIAKNLDVAASTISLNQKYRSAFFAGHSTYCDTIAKAQIENVTSAKPSGPLLVHLGKIYLGQNDMPEPRKIETKTLLRWRDWIVQNPHADDTACMFQLQIITEQIQAENE